jgi:hypothetical protein
MDEVMKFFKGLLDSDHASRESISLNPDTAGIHQ